MRNSFSGSEAIFPDDNRSDLERIRSVECPKCSRHTIVSTQSGVYLCLSCGFKHDTESGFRNRKRSTISEAVLAIGGFLLVAALIL